MVRFISVFGTRVVNYICLAFVCIPSTGGWVHHLHAVTKPCAGVPLASVKTTKVPGSVESLVVREADRRGRQSPMIYILSLHFNATFFTCHARMHLCSYPNSGIPAVLIELERFIDKAITAPRPFTALPWCRYTFHLLFMFGCVQNNGYDVMGILRVSAEENKVNRSFLRTFVQFILALNRYVDFFCLSLGYRSIACDCACLHYLLRCDCVLSYATSD